MTSVFISYRRDDASGHAGRLSDRLVARLGPERVFMDVSDIQPGQNFEQAIERTLAQCDHLLAVIGPRWLSILDARLASGEDFVRSEIGAALARGTSVIPVLVGGARMPSQAQLPKELAGLARCQAVQIEDRDFDDDAARLVAFLAGDTGTTGGRAGSRRLIASLAAAAVIFAGGWWLWHERTPDAMAPAGATAVSPTVDANIDGDWVAELRKPEQAPFRIRLTLSRVGADVIGTVRYPTGDAAILDGRFADGQLTFQTSHIPQFGSVAATIRVQGRLDGETFRMTVADEGGVATGTARRVDGPSSP